MLAVLAAVAALLPTPVGASRFLSEAEALYRGRAVEAVQFRRSAAIVRPGDRRNQSHWP